MELSRQLIITAAALVFSVYLALAVPAHRSDSSMQGDFSHLVNLIDKLKRLGTDDNDDDNWAVLSTSNKDGNTHPALSTGPASSNAEKVAALKQGFLGFNKRQGSWSYDYGLGGGRFGKRYYGDYGIGGGRFGRDVDHVDVADTRDNTL